ncbi:hypothetical protein [Actinoplanes sp. L3-i22]|uniref:hypothetical protein n=1 Tax=Actinoplanes sp. L3-i22 TaxID=2836373 RepID=UPI001C7825D7|nr:hypothetical protein [Actinoplanes sp. L3-i22]BCY06330.1 hypothetical protein L3i22_014180 [Actinoplanes sp. L3-i22]
MRFLPGKTRQPSAAPLHAAGELELTPAMDRDHWWSRITEQTRRRIAAEAGATVRWWATDDYDNPRRPRGTVLGADALVVMDGAERLTVYRYVRRSLTEARVRQRPSKAAPGDVVANPAAPVDLDLGLGESIRGFLGNLPAEAQQRMQQPFLDGDRIVHHEYFYYGNEEEMDVWCYLAGTANITFLAGHRKARRGAPPHAVTWDLTCYHAPLAQG